MGKGNVVKRGNVYQYKFEIASVDGKRKFKNKRGFKTKTVSKRLGHSTIETTYNIYVKVTTKMESDIVTKFEHMPHHKIIYVFRTCTILYLELTSQQQR